MKWAEDYVRSDVLIGSARVCLPQSLKSDTLPSRVFKEPTDRQGRVKGLHPHIYSSGISIFGVGIFDAILGMVVLIIVCFGCCGLLSLIYDIILGLMQ